MTKLRAAQLICAIAATLVFASVRVRAVNAEGLLEWLCRQLGAADCGQLEKLSAMRGEPLLGFGKTLLVYDPVAATRTSMDCDECRSPTALSPHEVAIRTPLGLSVVDVVAKTMRRVPTSEQIVEIIGARTGSDRGPLIVMLAGAAGCCPTLASLDLVSGATLERRETCNGVCQDLPKPGTLKGAEQLYVAGSEGDLGIYARRIDRRVAPARLILLRAQNDRTEWLDPQWLGAKIVFVTR
jgi:hypothetical protein